MLPPFSCLRMLGGLGGLRSGGFCHALSADLRTHGDAPYCCVKAGGMIARGAQARTFRFFS